MGTGADDCSNLVGSLGRAIQSDQSVFVAGSELVLFTDCEVGMPLDGSEVTCIVSTPKGLMPSGPSIAAIAGGAGGGVVVVLLLASLLLCLLVFRRRQKTKRV